MLSRVRLLLAWLVIAALPLQGLAAATMAFCGVAHHDRTHAAQAQAAPAGVAGAQHDHAGHPHADPAGNAVADGQTAELSQPLADVNHSCGICAACCHGAAIASLAQWPLFAPLPQAGWAEPFVLIHAPPSGVPDKPPRA